MPAITVATRPDGVAVLTFDQPGSKANVLTRELWTEFGDALAQLAPRTDVKQEGVAGGTRGGLPLTRGLVLASAKPGIFIAGADLKLLANAPGPNDPEVRAFIELGLRVLEQLEALPFPTCAAIDGAALGGGLEVALACDYRVCGTNPKVQFGLPEVKLGLIPGWGGTQRLPRIAGLASAAELLTTGKSVSGSDSAPLYFAGKVAPSDALIDTACSLLTTSALTQTKIASLMRGQQPQPEWAVSRLLKQRPIFEMTEGSEPSDFTHDFVPPAGLTGAAAEAVRVMTAGAALPLYDAIKLETEAFMRLAGSDESKRLIAEFFAIRKK